MRLPCAYFRTPAILFCVVLVLSACIPVPTPLPLTQTRTPSASTSASQPQSILAKVEAISPSTVRFTFAHPDPAFLQKLAFSAFGPGSPANIRQYNGGGDLIRNPVGTGPFRFVKWADGDYITLERNEDYWGPKPALKTLTYRVIKEPASRFLELRAGTVDGVDNLAPDDIAAAQADPEPGGVYSAAVQHRLPGHQPRRTSRSTTSACARQSRWRSTSRSWSRRSSRPPQSRRRSSCRRTSPATAISSRTGPTIRPGRGSCWRRPVTRMASRRRCG